MSLLRDFLRRKARMDAIYSRFADIVIHRR
ncbi:hypothetical protein FHS81_002145 [Pseudochelatococcus contaminans]|uniref:Uncharacterized protein n=1 Tax=Pseudochelatococcus contaminans TaxID=1538103 RepID=A0A7W5Z4R3_9HYPH|nr:hypothetical protein [Pseudochelatococcus contaminans]